MINAITISQGSLKVKMSLYEFRNVCKVFANEYDKEEKSATDLNSFLIGCLEFTKKQQKERN